MCLVGKIASFGKSVRDINAYGLAKVAFSKKKKEVFHFENDVLKRKEEVV